MRKAGVFVSRGVTDVIKISKTLKCRSPLLVHKFSVWILLNIHVTVNTVMSIIVFWILVFVIVKKVFITPQCVRQTSISLYKYRCHLYDTIYFWDRISAILGRRYCITHVLISWINFQQTWSLSNLFIEISLGVHEIFSLSILCKMFQNK